MEGGNRKSSVFRTKVRKTEDGGLPGIRHPDRAGRSGCLQVVLPTGRKAGPAKIDRTIPDRPHKPSKSSEPGRPSKQASQQARQAASPEAGNPGAGTGTRDPAPGTRGTQACLAWPAWLGWARWASLAALSWPVWLAWLAWPCLACWPGLACWDCLACWAWWLGLPADWLPRLRRRGAGGAPAVAAPGRKKGTKIKKNKQIFGLFWGPDSGPTFNYHSTQRDGNWAQNPAPIRENQRAQVL